MRVFLIRRLSAVLLAIAPALVAAQTPPAEIQPPPTDGEEVVVAPADAVNLEAIVVSGRQPGPGLWKVRRGDNVLWILGTQNPLPKRMEWDSSRVERRIAASQQVLLPPSVDLDADIGFFRRLTLIPSLFKARKNPDGRTLQQIVPAEQYARWQMLKKRYIGNDDGIEEWRPVFAALELYNEAIEKSGMSQRGVVSDAVERAAKRSDVPTVTPTVKIKIKDAKAAIREFSRVGLEDQECFRRTLDRIEGDLGNMAARANAWAEGDTEALRDLPFRNQLEACAAVFTGTELARKQGIADIQQQVENVWLREVEAALGRNASTFAVLPIGMLLRPNGYLAKLAAKGYVIEEP